MPLANAPTSVPVVVDEEKCIADKGCTVCVDVCPLDVPASPTPAVIDARREEGLLVLTVRGEGGTRKTTFRPAENGSHLTLDVSITGRAMGIELRYQLTYRRG